MKTILQFNEFVNEKVNVNKYLSKIEKNENVDLLPELRAMLDVLAFAEGTFKYPDNGYKTHYAGSQFSSYSDHPRKVITAGNYSSSASGRYQFLSKTWDEMMRGEDFSPKNQDIGAVKLLKQRGAIKPLLKGDFKKSIKKIKNIWASLPWSKYGQPNWFGRSDDEKFDKLETVYNNRLSLYKGEISDEEYKQKFKQEVENDRPLKVQKDIFKLDNKFPIKINQNSGENIISLQNKIIEMGGSLPKFGVDGKFGRETMNSLKKVLGKDFNFEKRNQITEEEYKNIMNL